MYIIALTRFKYRYNIASFEAWRKYTSFKRFIKQHSNWEGNLSSILTQNSTRYIISTTCFRDINNFKSSQYITLINSNGWQEINWRVRYNMRRHITRSNHYFKLLLIFIIDLVLKVAYIEHTENAYHYCHEAFS